MRRLFNLLGHVWRWFFPSVGRLPLPPATRLPKPLTLSQHAAGEALTQTLRLLVGHQTGSCSQAAVYPLCGRAWWSDHTPPGSTEPDVAPAWQRLDTLGLECEIAAWAEAATRPGIAALFSEALVCFQLRETLLAAGDACPCPWGTTAYQAAVAAHNLLWLASAEARGGSQELLQPVRRAVDHWLSSAGGSGSADLGDLVLLDLLHQGLVRQRLACEHRLELAEAELTRRQDAAHRNYPSRIRRWCPLLRYGAVRQIEADLGRVQYATHLVGCAQAALDAFDRAIGQWRALSPLTRATTAGSNGTVVSFSGLPLAAGLDAQRPQPDGVDAPGTGQRRSEESGCEGLAWWLVREMGRRTPLGPTPPSQASDFLSEIAKAAGHPLIGPPARAALSHWLFLLRFFHVWGGLCPPSEVAAAQIRGWETQTRDAWRPLADLWEATARATGQVSNNALAGTCAQAIVAERFRMSEPGQGSVWVKLETIRRRIQGVVDIDVDMGVDEDVDEQGNE